MHPLVLPSACACSYGGQAVLPQLFEASFDFEAVERPSLLSTASRFEARVSRPNCYALGRVDASRKVMDSTTYNTIIMM